jgi:hypothetical protein
MNCIRRLLLLLALTATLLPAHPAEEKKDEKKKEPPKITGAFPFAIVPGATNKIRIRGLSLTNATAVHFPSTSNLAAEIKSRGKASVPEKADPKKLGDTQLEVELVLPADFPAGDLPFFVTAPEGETTTNQLRVIEQALFFDEKEPNAGFRKPNEVTLPQTIRGTIEAANDVDVFRFTGRAGQKVRIESFSVRYGSSLDPIVTLHDARGHTLASSDDTSGGADALVRFTLPSNGPYFLSIIDAHDRGGTTYGYVLVLRKE